MIGRVRLGLGLELSGFRFPAAQKGLPGLRAHVHNPAVNPRRWLVDPPGPGGEGERRRQKGGIMEFGGYIGNEPSRKRKGIAPRKESNNRAQGATVGHRSEGGGHQKSGTNGRRGSLWLEGQEPQIGKATAEDSEAKLKDLSRDLHGRIQQIDDPEDLIALVQAEVSEPHFDHVNALACLHRLSSFVDSEGNMRLERPPKQANGAPATLPRSKGPVRRNFRRSLGSRKPAPFKKRRAPEGSGAQLELRGTGRDAAMLRTMIRDYTSAVESLERRTTSKISEMGGSTIANALWAFAKVQQRPAPHVMKSLEKRLGQHISRLSSQALATAMWAFATMGATPNGKLLKAVEARVTRNIHTYSSQNIVSVIWAMVKLDQTPGRELMEVADSRLASLLERSVNAEPTKSAASAENRTAHQPGMNPGPKGLTAKATANLLWAWARTQHEPPKRLRLQVEARIEGLLPQFYPRHLANMMWAFAKIQWSLHRSDFLVAYENRVIELGDQFETQGLTNILWAFSRMQIQPSNALFRSLTDGLAHKASECNAQDIANALYSFAKLSRAPSKECSSALRQQMMQHRQQLNPQMLSNILWAFAKLDSPPQENELLALEEQTTKRIKHFNAQALGNTLWAYATLELHPKPEFIRMLTNRIVKVIDDYTPQNVANTYWSLARLLLEPPRHLANALSRRSRVLMKGMRPQNTANILWAFARLGRGLDEKLAQALEAQLDSAVEVKIQEDRLIRVPSQNPRQSIGIRGGGPPSGSQINTLKPMPSGNLNSQDLANSLWAMVVLDRTKSPLFTKLWNMSQKMMGWDSRELVQLYEVYSYVTSKNEPVDGNLAESSSVIRWSNERDERRAREECAKIQALEKQTTSKFHYQVSDALTSLGLGHINEIRVGIWSVDIHVTEPGLDHVLIEADGPSHYLHESTIENGPAVLKHRALSDLGWTVVHIPYFEWKTKYSEADRVQYLRSLLQTALKMKRGSREKRMGSRFVI